MPQNELKTSFTQSGFRMVLAGKKKKFSPVDSGWEEHTNFLEVNVYCIAPPGGSRYYTHHKSGGINLSGRTRSLGLGHICSTARIRWPYAL